MKTDTKLTPMRALIVGDPRRPRRIALETLDGSPMPEMADRKYLPVNGSLVPFEPQKRPDDGSKAVRISTEAYERLRTLRLRGESASRAMERLIYGATNNGK